jgi:hypothetical protein
MLQSAFAKRLRNRSIRSIMFISLLGLTSLVRLTAMFLLILLDSLSNTRSPEILLQIMLVNQNYLRWIGRALSLAC